jgi:hypothetical protein
MLAYLYHRVLAEVQQEAQVDKNMNDELIQILKDYVATANNPKYGGNWDVINSKFPELSGYDSQLLKDYVATANNSSYGGEWNTINSKFPEFFEGVKKKEPSVSTSQEAAMEQPMATGSSELPKSAGQLPDFTALRQQQQVETYGQVEPAAQVEDRLSPQAKAKIDERIKLGEVQAAPAVKGEAMVDVGDKLAYLWDSGVNVLADLSQNIRQSVTGLDRTYVYEFVENNKERLPELYNEYTKLKGQGASDEDAAYGAYLQTVAIDPTIETRVNSFVRSRNKEKVREEVGSDLSKEQREKIASDLVPSAIGGLIESTPAMLSSASTYGLSFFDLAYKGAEDMLAQEFEQNPDLKLTPAQQEEYKLASGAVMAVLEKIGLSNTLKANPLVRRALTSRVLSSMAGLGKDASSEVFERVVRKELGTIARIGKNIGSGFLAEAETGALQELSQNGLNYYVNETSGKTVFDGKSATELVKDVLRAGIAEGIGGGFIAGAVNVFANPDAITEEDFDKAKKFASEVDIKKVQEHLADEMAAGKITKDEASQILNNINEFRAVANSVPENVSKEAQAKIFKLIKEKQDISKSVAGKDEAIQSVAKEQIKAIDDQIKELYVTSKTPTQDAVQEQATDEGVLRPEQPEVGLQEVVEGDQEPQVVAEEGVEEEVAYGAGTIGTLLNERVSYSDPVSGETVEGDLFVDGQRVVLEAAGGQQFDLGNVDEVLGLNIEEAALVAPAEMAIIPQEDGSFVFNKEGNQKVAKGTTMFNRQPGLQAIRRDAEGKVDRVTMYSEDGTETYNLTGQEAEDAAYYIVRGFVETQEGQDAINQLAQRNEEARRDLSQPLGTRAVQQAAPQAPAPVRVEAPAGPAVEAAVEDDIQAQEVADLAAEMQAAAPTTVERLNRVAERARKAISKVIPDVKIIVHDTDAAYREASGDAEQGVYIPATKTIHINASKATPGAVAHEVFHAVFLDRVKTDVAAQRAAKKMVESLKRVVGEGSELYQYLDAFSQNYDANFQNEEKLSELAAVLAENYMGLETSGLSKGAIASFKQAVKDFINAIAKRFGTPMPSTLTDADVIGVLNAIAQKTVTGEVITEADIIVLDRLAEPGSVVTAGPVAADVNESGADVIDLQNRNRRIVSREGVDIPGIQRGSINDLSGANAFVFAADQAVYGRVKSPSGVEYFFMGGYLFPYGNKDGAAWAFTDVVNAKKVLKKVQDSDGIGLVMSQAAEGVTGSYSFYEYMLEEIQNAVANGAKEQDIVAYVNKKLSNTDVSKALESKGKPTQIKSLAELENLMPFEGKGKLSYAERGAFTKQFFSAESYDKFGIPPLKPTAKMTTGVLDYANDPSLERVQYGDIVSAIQFDKNSAIVDTRKEPGMQVHPSYPIVIFGKPLMVFDKAVDVRKVYPNAVPKAGSQVPLGERSKPTAAKSAMGGQYISAIPTVQQEGADIDFQNDTYISPAIRQRRGLINVTEREATKYAKIGINDQRVMQAMEDIGLAGVKFTKGDVETAIAKAFDEAIDDISSSNTYKGESVVITQDSPGITRAIEAEIATLEEQGAPSNIVERAKRNLDSESSRNEYIQQYQGAQIETLNQWTSYLSQSDYDPAFKLMMLDAVVTNNYDSNTKKYIKRDSKTIRNITPFDAGTLAQLYGMTDSKELLKTYVEIQADNAENIVKANEMKSTKDGKWLKFNGGKETPAEERAANATALSQLVQDTPWCTKTNASSQLNGGDFYVYATKATDGRYIPRVAVRMEKDRVGELRGVASSKQDLEPDMLPVAEKFLREEIPNDSGKKWLDSVEYGKRVKAYTEELRGRKVTMDDFKKYGEIKADETKYSVDYGKNGFVERLEEVIRTKVVVNDLSPDLAGRVAISPSSVNKDTRILFGDVRNLDERNMSDYVGLEMIMGDARWESKIGNFPPNLKTITGKVTLIDRADSIGNIEVIGGELELRTDYIKTLGNLKSAGYIDVDKAFASLEDLGNLEEINVMYGSKFLMPKNMTSLGKIKRVNGSISLDVYSKLESFGDLEYISKGLLINSDKIKSLGKIKTVGGRLRVEGSSQITSLGSVEYVGGMLDIDQSNIKDIPNLKYVDKSALFPYGIKSIAGIYFGEEISYYNGTKGPSVKKVNGHLSVWSGKANELTDLGDVEEVTRGLTVSGASSLGNIKIVGGDLSITNRGDGRGVTSIEKLEQVGRNVIIYSAVKINSFGSLKSIGGNITASKVTGIGALQSVGKHEISQKTMFLDGLLSDAYAENPESIYPVVNKFAQDYIDFNSINKSIKQQIKDLYIKSAYDLIGAEMPPQTRQRKGSPAFENWSASPKSGAQKLGHMYNMNHKGFAPKTIDPMHFKRDVERLDKRLSVRKTTLGTGYYMTLDGRFFNPYERVVGGNDGDANGLRQRINSQTTNIFDIVETARAKGYTDKTIELYLKQEGFDAAEIKNALAVTSGLNGAEVPVAFGYVQGGMAVGQSLFSEIQEKLNKLTNEGADKATIRVEAQRLLMDSEVYKAQNEDVQAQLRLSLDASIGTNAAARAFSQEFKELRAIVSAKKRAARELNAIKAKVRGFIRKNLPQGEYSKADVVKLLKAIVDANADSLPLVLERVENYVTEYKVSALEKQVKKLLDTKTTTIVEGRRVGRLGIDAQNQLALLTSKEKPMLANEDMSESQVEDMITEHLKEYNSLMAQTYLSKDESLKLGALEIAMKYNGAYMMENNNPNKITELQDVVDNISAMIAIGRAEILDVLDQKRGEYIETSAEVYYEISGEKLDTSNTPEAIEKNKKNLRNAKNIEEKKKRFSNRLKMAIGKLSSGIDNYFTRQSDLPLLLSRITTVATESFGGKLQEMFDGRLFDSRSEFTRRMIEIKKLLDKKSSEIFGKDYKSIMMMNAAPRFSKDLVNDTEAIFDDQMEAEKLRKEYKSANEKDKKRIIAWLSDHQIVLSPNQDYYLYNQYKDPANRESFSEMYGKDNYAIVMKIITNRIDPKLKEWADWQVNELFPSLYDAYNAVYKEVYRTNMPWNQFYAGRIYREGQEGDNTFDLLAGATEYRTSVGGQSTKSRVKNNRKIEHMDGNQALSSYLEDMEYFRAYAEVMRDINKLLENKNIEAAINKVAGANTYEALKDMMTKVATRGIKNNESQLINRMMSNFVVAKLGINPKIGLGQLTSAIAFSDYIGWGNWSLYMGKAMPNAKSLWKEWYDNSPVLQDRYENSNMAEVLEGYKKNDFVSDPVLINKKVFGKRVLISDKTISDWQNGLTYFIKLGDKGGVMGGLANYLYYKDEFKAKNPGATEQQAIDYASRKATRQAISTQQDSGITNKDWYQTSGPATRFLNLFLSSPKANLRKEMYAFMQLSRKINKKASKFLGKEYKKESAGSLVDNLRTLITYHVGLPMFFQWIVLGLPGVLSDWDEDDEESLGRAAILGNLNALFIVGDLLVAAKDLIEKNPWAGEFKTLPIFEQANQIVQDIERYSQAKKPETKEKHFNRLVAHSVELTGLPATSIQRMYDNLSKLADSDLDEAILRLFNFSDYVIEEKANEKEKK